MVCMTQTPPPSMAPEDISPVRLHGHACYHCGAVDTPLDPDGEVRTRAGEGVARVWPIVTCRPCKAQQ